MIDFFKKHFLIILAIIYFIWPFDLLPGIVFDDLAALIASALIELIRDTIQDRKNTGKNGEETKKKKVVIDGEEA